MIIKKGTTGSLGKKEENDKFYTKDKIVDYCLNKINISDYDCIIEPSAGNGSFSDKINNCFAYDILPENPNIIKADWLKLNKNQFDKYKNILIIGNPPYGKNNSLSLKFIKESVFANTIAFILPKSFQKESLLNKINHYFHLVEVIDLPNDSFLLNNQSYSLKTAFFIFKKMKYKRAIKDKKLQSSYFSFVNKNENPDFRIQRVGVKAGSISKDLNRSSSSNYFIKVNTKLISKNDFYNKIKSIDFSTVTDLAIGPKSLSKRELIEIFEE